MSYPNLSAAHDLTKTLRLFVSERIRRDENGCPENPLAPRLVAHAPVSLEWRFFKPETPTDLAHRMRIAKREKQAYLDDNPAAKAVDRQFTRSFQTLKARVDQGRVPRITNIVAYGLQSLHQYRLDTADCKTDNTAARSRLLDLLKVRDILSSARDPLLPCIVEGPFLSRTDKSHLSSLGLIPISDPEIFNHINAGTLVLNFGEMADMDFTSATNVFPAAYMTMDHVTRGYEAWEQRAARFLRSEYRATPLVEDPDSDWRVYTRRLDVEAIRRPGTDGRVETDGRPWVNDGVFV